MLAWISYSGDYDGNLVHNTHGGEAQSNSANSRYAQWIMGWLDWGLRPDNTNVLHVTDSRYMPSWQHFRETVKTWFTAPRTNTLVPLRKRRDGPNESEPSP